MKPEWYLVESRGEGSCQERTYAMNTATGVIIERTVGVDTGPNAGDETYRVTTLFIAGEHWDPKAGKFVDIKARGGAK